MKYKEKSLVGERVIVVNSFFRKLLGLSFRRRPHCSAMVFEFHKPSRIAMSMRFMNFPVTFIWLLRGSIVEIYGPVLPWGRVPKPHALSDTVVEIPHNH